MIKKHKEFLNIELDDQVILKHLSNFEEKIKVLEDLDLDPMHFTFENYNFELREDEVKENNEYEILFQNTEHIQGREIEIPKVMD